jgi:hypothetical protein
VVLTERVGGVASVGIVSIGMDYTNAVKLNGSNHVQKRSLLV